MADEGKVEDAPVPLVTHVNNIFHSIFSDVEVYINNQQIYSSNGFFAQKSLISNNFKGAISEFKSILQCKGAKAMTWRKLLMVLRRHPRLIHFLQAKRKC